jgi:hypothetical protein
MNPLVRLKKTTPPFVFAILFLFPAPFLNAGVGSAAAREIELGLTTLKRQIAASSPVGSGWTVVPTPNTGSRHNYFYGVAAIASNDVWAVGGYGNLTTQAQQLVQHWHGQNWTMVPTPILPTTYNELQAISAVSANDVWAVGGGDGQALIEHWNGISWSVVPHPNPGTFNRFFGVAAVSSNDVWAVGVTSDGGLSQTLVEHWDGKVGR